MDQLLEHASELLAPEMVPNLGAKGDVAIGTTLIVIEAPSVSAPAPVVNENLAMGG
jgi:hypothetical protein